MTISKPLSNTTTTCVTTMISFPHFNLSPITTTYLSTVTGSAEVDCGGCELAIETILRGVGPVSLCKHALEIICIYSVS
jgi:hypothetical protein